MDPESIQYQQNLIKLQKYCSYQDRCHQEVRRKLLSLKIFGDELEQIMSDLIQNDYLNEERYARSFVRGKFRMKRWGRSKIRQKLYAKEVSSYCIKKGMDEIDDEEYQMMLNEIIREEVSKLKPPINKIALTKRLMLKGYEYPLILESLKVY